MPGETLIVIVIVIVCGGGGGSGCVQPSATSASLVSGAQAGHGLIVITW